MNDRMLESALRRLSGSGKVVLLLDELGNVLSNDAQDSWSILGVIRSYAHSGKIKIIATSFQEFFLRQQDDYSGPWVNFASVMRLNSFTDEEVKRFVLDPFSFWAETHNATALLDLIATAIGSHPLLLQYFCQSAFFKLIANDSDNPNLLDVFRAVATTDMITNFSEPVSELFYRLPSPLLKYLFISFCSRQDSVGKGTRLNENEIDDDWIEKELKSLNLDSTTLSRRNLLEGLETRGLTEPVAGNHGRQVVICPLIFYFLKRAEKDLDAFRHKLRREALREAKEWKLQSEGGY
jgi:hypothetical protein